MSSQDLNQQQRSGQGPGQSVSLSASPTASRGITVPAGDHPLAAGALRVEQAVTSGNSSSPPRPMSIPTAPPPPPLRTPVAPRPVATPPPNNLPMPNARVTSASGSPTKSLDALADAFLSAESYRTAKRGLAPVLRPSPLPPGEGIERLRMLVERRAWGDVLKLSTSILNSKEDPHADVYASLLILPTNASKTDVTTISLEIRHETVEIMTLQCHAWLKLRRYGDLASEIERWNFLKQNDASAESPKWLSWGIRTLFLCVLEVCIIVTKKKEKP